MSKILALDTSTDACSIALLIDNKVSDRFVIMSKQHTKLILPMIDEVLSEAGIGLNQLDALAFGCGPGSFTGVRLAASIIQGFAFAADLPVVSVSTLRALAQEVFVEFKVSKVLVIQDARMNEVYLGQYQVGDRGVMQAIEPDSLTKPEEAVVILQDYLVGVGSGFEIYSDIFAKKSEFEIIAKKHIQAKYLVQLASYDFDKNRLITAEHVLPVYLRDKVVRVRS